MGNSALYSTIIRAGSTTYFVDIKESKNKKKSVVITESQTKKGDVNIRNVIKLNEENFANFQQAIDEVGGILANDK